MNRFFFLILIFLSAGALRAAATEKIESESPGLVWEMSEKEIYSNELSVLNLVLYSNTADVAYAEAIENFGLENGRFGILSRFKGRNRVERVKYKNKDCLRVVLASYIFNIENSGSIILSGGEYAIGLNYKVVINDPFWGPVSTYRTSEFKLTPPDLKIKVKGLPSGAPAGFSGAVGIFNMETIPINRQIIVGERARVLIRLKGTGYIPDNILPDYKKAFGKGLKLLSATDGRWNSIENGKVISIVEVECEFLVESKECNEIGRISFTYFDPKSGKYVESESKPLKLDIVSSVVKRDLMEI